MSSIMFRLLDRQDAGTGLVATLGYDSGAGPAVPQVLPELIHLALKRGDALAQVRVVRPTNGCETAV